MVVQPDSAEISKGLEAVRPQAVCEEPLNHNNISGYVLLDHYSGLPDGDYKRANTFGQDTDFSTWQNTHGFQPQTLLFFKINR